MATVFIVIVGVRRRIVIIGRLVFDREFCVRSLGCAVVVTVKLNIVVGECCCGMFG